MILVLDVWAFVRTLLANSAAVSLENVVLRHQLAVLRRSVSRPRLHRRDRVFLVGLSKLWAGWRARPVLFQPPTVPPLHRPSFPPYSPWEAPHPPAGRP